MSHKARGATLQAVALILIALYFFLWAMHGFAAAQEPEEVPGGTGPTKCPSHYYDGAPPVLLNAKALARTVELCSQGFAVLHSALTKGPMYSAEHLTPQALAAAPARDNAFHADPRLPRGERAEMADYERSGFDRGHMTPSGDAGSEEAQQETFALSNMVPQDKMNNRVTWRLIEEKVRAAVKANGDLWVVTGPLFIGQDVQAIGRSQVLVPTHIWKAVFDPRRNTAVVYVVKNKDAPDLHLLTVDDFAKLYFIEPFPSLPPGVRLSMAFPLQ